MSRPHSLAPLTSTMHPSHRIDLRVYWEDTDAGGVVYYANYLKFAERARTEMLRDVAIEQQDLREKTGLTFVVTRCEVNYHAPARLDDTLSVRTALHEVGKVRMTMRQEVWRDDVKLASLQVSLACVDDDRKPRRFPPFMIEAMTQ